MENRIYAKVHNNTLYSTYFIIQKNLSKSKIAQCICKGYFENPYITNLRILTKVTSTDYFPHNFEIYKIVVL